MHSSPSEHAEPAARPAPAPEPADERETLPELTAEDPDALDEALSPLTPPTPHGE